MQASIVPIAEWCAAAIEILGLLLITLFAVISLFTGVVRLARGEPKEEVFRNVRQILGHGILLGLEFLVAADIVHTVAIEFTFKSVGVLAIIVLIRTFLSFTLDVELTGKWPWQRFTKSTNKNIPPGNESV